MDFDEDIGGKGKGGAKVGGDVKVRGKGFNVKIGGDAKGKSEVNVGGKGKGGAKVGGKGKGGAKVGGKRKGGTKVGRKESKSSSSSEK